MKTNDSIIYAELERLRDEFITGTQEICVDAELKIEDQLFIKNIWFETHEKGKIIVFMVQNDAGFFSKHYCLGLIVNNDKTIEFLSNEELWDIGIP